MGKSSGNRGFSIRRDGEYLDIRIFSGGKIVFKGGCNVNDVKKVESLINVLRAKGVSIPVEPDGWW